MIKHLKKKCLYENLSSCLIALFSSQTMETNSQRDYVFNIL